MPHVAPRLLLGVRREYLRRLKGAFDQRGIEIPYPHMTLYAGANKDGEAPEFRLRTAGWGHARRASPADAGSPTNSATVQAMDWEASMFRARHSRESQSGGGGDLRLLH